MLALKSEGTLVLVSSFYTAALELPLERALSAHTRSFDVVCVPYNQLNTFLLDPKSALPEGRTARVILLLRVEDLIRLELVSLGQNGAHRTESCIGAFRERREQLLEVLGRISHLSLSLMICPSGYGACETRFLGNSIYVAEHKIAAELRRQHRHLVIGWAEFERTAKPENCFNRAGDRLGHVPFSPAGLDALAKFLVAQIDRMPVTTSQAGQTGSLDLEDFLTSLDVQMSVARLEESDEETLINLIRHTTHFVNLLNRKWEAKDFQAFARTVSSGEAWVIRIRDRLGDYGVSGALTFEMRTREMQVQSLFLTCPVLGRGVEYAFMSWMGRLAEQRGAQFIRIPFEFGRDNGALASMLEHLSGERPASAAGWGEMNGQAAFLLVVAGLAERVKNLASSPACLGSILANMKDQAAVASA